MNQEIKERIELINKGMVPAGYKKTPVGICPVEWEENIYRNLGEFAKGKGIPGYALLDNGLPCVGYGDIYTKYNIKFNAAKCFTDEITAKDSKKISKNTLLFTGSGETAEEIGKCVCYCGDEDISAGGDIILFNSYNVNPLFLSYQQNFWPFIKEKARLGQGHSVVHIYPDDISKLHAIFPKTKPEQEKIAEILDCATRQVELQEQLVDKLKVQKKALMQKLLTQQPDWQKLKLKNIINFYNGYSFKSETYVKNGAFYVITISNVKDDGFILQEDTSTIEKIPTDIRDYQILRKGDILISMTGNVGRVCKVECDNCLLNQRVGKIEVKKEFDKNFIFYSLQSYSFVEKMKLLAQGAAQDNMSVKDINNYIIWLPRNKEIQSKISNLLSNIDKQIELQQKLLKKYKLRQKTMMQLLLTGIVRVC